MAADEMVSALTYREGQFHLATQLDEFKERLAWRAFGNLDRILLLRSVLAALGRDIYAKDWADLMIKPEVRERLPEAFEEAEAGINRALQFLEGLGVTCDRLLPYGLQLVFSVSFSESVKSQVLTCSTCCADGLGDILHWLVRRGQYRASGPCTGRSSQVSRRHGNRVQYHRFGYGRPPVSRALRWT